MTKPADVSQWAWDEARWCRFGQRDYKVELPGNYVLCERIARSLDAAHAAGKAEQRDADAAERGRNPNLDAAEAATIRGTD